MNLLKSLAAVSSMTMFSRVLGFARDAIVARIFGAGMATDAFFVAFKLPNLLRRIFAEGAFSQAFVPILAEYKSKQGEDATRVFVSYVSGLLTLALAVVTDDAKALTAAPGIGKKIAQRIILELKDKLAKEALSGADEMKEIAAVTDSDAPAGDALSEAMQALKALGYSPQEAASALKGVAGKAETADEMIKLALRHMAQQG